MEAWKQGKSKLTRGAITKRSFVEVRAQAELRHESYWGESLMERGPNRAETAPQCGAGRRHVRFWNSVEPEKNGSSQTRMG